MQKWVLCTYIFYQISFVFFGVVILFQPLKKFEKQFFCAVREKTTVFSLRRKLKCEKLSYFSILRSRRLEVMIVRENWARDGYTQHASPPRTPCSFLLPCYNRLLRRLLLFQIKREEQKTGAGSYSLASRRLSRYASSWKNSPKPHSSCKE